MILKANTKHHQHQQAAPIPFRLRFYLHRIGRSGRFGRKGVAVNFMRSDGCWNSDGMILIKPWYDADQFQLTQKRQEPTGWKL